MRSENIHEFCATIAKNLLDERDFAVTALEAPCPTPLVSSICLLRPRGEGPRLEFHRGHSFSSLLFFPPSSCPSSSPCFPSPAPTPRPHFSAASSFCLARSVLLSLRHSLLHRRERPTTITDRRDYLWQLRGGSKGGVTFLSGCPRAPVPPPIERD